MELVVLPSGKNPLVAMGGVSIDGCVTKENPWIVLTLQSQDDQWALCQSVV